MEIVYLNDDEFREFQTHPVKSFDPHFTRSYDNFRHAWTGFLERLRRLLVDAHHLSDHHSINKLHQIYYDTVFRIEVFERATNIVLISYVDSSGRMRQNSSCLRDIYDMRYTHSWVTPPC